MNSLHVINKNKMQVFGREEDAKRLREVLEMGGDGAEITQRVVHVNGELGVGRTTFVKEYYAMYQNEYDMAVHFLDIGYSVFNYSSYFKEQFANLPANTIPSSEKFESFIDFFSKTSMKCLIVFTNLDNVDAAELDRSLSRLLPLREASRPNLHIVVTRNEGAPYNVVNFELGSLSCQASQALMQSISPWLSSHSSYGMALLALGNPRLIHLISCYARQKNIDSVSAIEPIFATNYPCAMVQMHKAILEALRSDMLFQERLLRYLVWLGPVSFKPEWLELMNQAIESKFVLYHIHQVMRSLVDYGVATFSDGIYMLRRSSTKSLQTLLFSNREAAMVDMTAMVSILIKISSHMPNVKQIESLMIQRHLFFIAWSNLTFDDPLTQSLLNCVCAETSSLIFKDQLASVEFGLKAAHLADGLPQASRALKCLGNSYRSPSPIQSYHLAIKYFQTAFDNVNDPSKPNEKAEHLRPYLQNQIGDCFSKLGDHGTALKFHERAIQYCSDISSIDYHESLYYIGLVHFHLQNYPLSIHYLKQSSDLSPKNSVSKIALAKSYAMNNQIALAKKTMEQVYNIIPLNSVNNCKLLFEILLQKTEDDFKQNSIYHSQTTGFILSTLAITSIGFILRKLNLIE